jgi:hypothetical protein
VRTSAKENLNVEEAFKQLVEAIIATNSTFNPESGQREVVIKGKNKSDRNIKLSVDKNGAIADKKKKRK